MYHETAPGVEPFWLHFFLSVGINGFIYCLNFSYNSIIPLNFGFKFQYPHWILPLKMNTHFFNSYESLEVQLSYEVSYEIS